MGFFGLCYPNTDGIVTEFMMKFQTKWGMTED